MEENEFPLFKLRMIEAIAKTTSNLDALMCLNQLIGKANARVQADALAEHLSQNNRLHISTKPSPIKTTTATVMTTQNVSSKNEETSPTSSISRNRQIPSSNNTVDDMRSVSTRSTRSPPETPEHRRSAEFIDSSSTSSNNERNLPDHQQQQQQTREATPVHGLHVRRGVGGQTSSGGGRSSIIFG